MCWRNPALQLRRAAHVSSWPRSGQQLSAATFWPSDNCRFTPWRASTVRHLTPLFRSRLEAA